MTHPQPCDTCGLCIPRTFGLIYQTCVVGDSLFLQDDNHTFNRPHDCNRIHPARAAIRLRACVPQGLDSTSSR